NQLLMASPNELDPNVEEELRLRFNMPVRTVLCTPANINDVIAKFVPRDATAVEPAAAAPAQPAATAAAAAQPQAAEAAPAKAAKPTGPMTDAEKKERQQYAIVAFNMVGILTIIGMMNFTRMSAIIYVPLAVLLGAAAGGIMWKVRSR